MDVSVIVPTRLTRPDLLLVAVRSVYSQTSRPTELIVVIDGDETPRERIASWFPRDGDVATRFLFTGTPGGAGVSIARNLGAQAAFAPHLAFLDDDDYWLPGMLESFSSTTPDIGLASFLKQRTDGSVASEKVPPASLHPRKFLVCNPGLRGSNLLIRKDLFRELGGFAPDLPALNDLDFGIRLSSRLPKHYVRSCVPTVVFRSHGGARLTDRGSAAIAEGVHRFWQLYGSWMTLRERTLFWMRAGELWRLPRPPDSFESSR